MDTFKSIGAVAASLPIFADKPLNPQYTFKNIHVRVVHILARQIARNKVKAELRMNGAMVQFVLPRIINELARAYLHDHSDVWSEALAMAHRIDDKEGRRRGKLRLRRAELKRLAR